MQNLLKHVASYYLSKLKNGKITLLISFYKTLAIEGIQFTKKRCGDETSYN